MAQLPEVKDGRDGIDGKSIALDDVRPVLEAEVARWQVEFERRATDTLQRAIERMPLAKDGKDGRDGLSPEGFDAEIEGRTITFSLKVGDQVFTKTAKVSWPIYKGTYQRGQAYEQGDTVTYAGSSWIAKRDTATSPPGDDWQQCVARGRDGK
jgi:integrin beta 3